MLDQMYADREMIDQAPHTQNFRAGVLERQLRKKHLMPWKPGNRETKVIAMSFAKVWEMIPKKTGKYVLNREQRDRAKWLAEKRE